MKPLKFSLYPVLLPTAEATNNIADPGYSSSNAYLTGSGALAGVVYGLPAAGAIGMATDGAQVFPTFNNRASYTPEK